MEVDTEEKRHRTRSKGVRGTPVPPGPQGPAGVTSVLQKPSGWASGWLSVARAGAGRWGMAVEGESSDGREMSVSFPLSAVPVEPAIQELFRSVVRTCAQRGFRERTP